MGWWSESKTKGVTRDSGVQLLQPSEDASEREAAHDAVASILRSVGATAFGTEEQSVEKTEEMAESWAKHVLVASAPPGMVDDGDRRRRRWSGVQRFVSLELRQRHALFGKATNDLRDVAQALLCTVGSFVTETERTDQAVSVQLERLREATEGDSIDRIRAEAMSVVEQVGAAVAIRRERQRDQLARLSDRVQALRSQLETARKETECDPLTELPNRRAFDRYVSATVDFARLTGGTAILLFVDADHFKKVNDVHGHQAGDTALRFLADVFVRTFPRRGDFVARYGGEEFCIVLRDADPDWGERLADRVLEAVRRRPVKHEGTSFALTVSVGVASLRPSESAEEWLGRADRALYRAKASGRDRACLDDEACPGPHPQKQATQPAAQKSGGRFGSPWTGSEARQTSPVVLHPSPRSPR